MFYNLIDNAIKYTEYGEVELHVRRNEKDELNILVSDTGIGISEEYLPNIYNPFTQEEQGYTRKYEGNGLGLALVNKYCELNGAVVTINTAKGKGTTFSVTFEK